uniref:Glycosyltransferase-like protein LARGE2 n=1 Tax=Aureoumbra lagunensis TaxID=44058 RepID=A0A7S3K145_9STRA
MRPRGRKTDSGMSPLMPEGSGFSRRDQRHRRDSILTLLVVGVIISIIALLVILAKAESRRRDTLLYIKDTKNKSKNIRHPPLLKKELNYCNWREVKNDYVSKKGHRTSKKFIHSGFTSIDNHRRETTGEGVDFWSSEPKLKRRCPLNFTLVTQATTERLWMLKFICRRWSGPIVIAVYSQQGKEIPNLEKFCPGGQVHYQIISAAKEIFSDATKYPVNRLRNLALKHVQTSHFLLHDIDLWPDSTLYKRLHALISDNTDDDDNNNASFLQSTKSLLLDPLRAIVIPAFAREVKTECSSSTGTQDSTASYRMRECYREAERMPTSFQRLKQCIIQKECHIFDRYNQDGHGTTDYRAWLRQDSSQLRHIQCFLSNRYEPYVVLHKSPLLPAFEEKFTGYGKNKIQNLVHLRYAGFHFSVLPKSFLVHFPHHKSAARMAWEQKSTTNPPQSSEKQASSNNQAAHRATMDRLYRRFLDTLIAVYGSPGERPETTKLCGPDAVNNDASSSTTIKRRRLVKYTDRKVWPPTKISPEQESLLSATNTTIVQHRTNKLSHPRMWPQIKVGVNRAHFLRESLASQLISLEGSTLQKTTTRFQNNRSLDDSSKEKLQKAAKKKLLALSNLTKSSPQNQNNMVVPMPKLVAFLSTNFTSTKKQNATT